MFFVQARSLYGLTTLSYRLGHPKLLARLRRSSRTSQHLGKYLEPAKLYLEPGQAGRAAGLYYYDGTTFRKRVGLTPGQTQ